MDSNEENDMKDAINELKNDIRDVKQSLQSVDRTLIKQEENLKHHMYRTEIAEKRLEHIENGQEPVKKHVNGMNGALKLLGVLGLVAGILKAMGIL